VVLVHGDVYDATATFAMQADLAAEFRLRLVNRRGFGGSADVEGEDFDADAADVAALLEPGTHLVGHSYGGVVALLAAARRPEAVRSLTVVEPPALALTRDTAVTRDFIATLEALRAERPTPEDFLPRFVAAIGGDPARLPRPLPPALVRAAGVQLRGRFPWEAEIPLAALRASGIPTLVVSGGHHPLFDGVCDVLERELAARRVVLRGAGHGVPRLGAPFNAVLRGFWAGG